MSKIGEEIRKNFEKEWMRKDGTFNKRMVDYDVNKVSGYVRLTSGKIFVFDKESITTEFCFGYGFCGVSSEEEEMNASNNASKAKEKDVFFAENLKKFDIFDEILSEKSYYYEKENACGSDIVKLITAELYDNYYNKNNWVAVELTAGDKLLIERELEIQKAKFLKRLETYWKKYGNSKLRTWTYLVD